jgi:hypothetical protein
MLAEGNVHRARSSTLHSSTITRWIANGSVVSMVTFTQRAAHKHLPLPQGISSVAGQILHSPLFKVASCLLTWVHDIVFG